MLKNENLNWHRSFSKKLKIPKKSQKPLFLRWVIFDIFLQSVFCICILYFVFLSFCLFIFLSFFNFVLLLIGHWVSLTLGAVNLRQATLRPTKPINTNRHHHHQMNNSNAETPENVFGRITRKYTAQIRKYANLYLGNGARGALRQEFEKCLESNFTL